MGTPDCHHNLSRLESEQPQRLVDSTYSPSTANMAIGSVFVTDKTLLWVARLVS